MTNYTTIEQLVEAVQKALPNCDIDLDNEGQVIIYTNYSFIDGVLKESE